MHTALMSITRQHKNADILETHPPITSMLETCSKISRNNDKIRYDNNYHNQYKKLYSSTNIVRVVQSKLQNSKYHFGVDT